MLRNQLGMDFSGTNTAREGYELPPMQAGDVCTVDFYVDLPELYPASFSFSPAIADGTLMGYTMCDWIDNAVTLQMSRAEDEIYGYLHLPCRVEVNARIRGEAVGRGQPSPAGETHWLNSPASGSIPDQVNVDLLNEHMARYMFAARLASRQARAGCRLRRGLRFGRAGPDGPARGGDRPRGRGRRPSPASITRRPTWSFRRPPAPRCRFPAPPSTWWWPSKSSSTWTPGANSCWRCGACWRPPASSSSPRPTGCITQESRGSTGANPFHVHEFDFDEFRRELKLFFPHVSMYLENHTEGITFQPHEPGNTAEVRVDAAEAVAHESHFFLAVCADRPLMGNPTFVYVPRAANVLREREHHIVLLDSEIAQKNEWLADAQRRHEELLARFAEQKESLERSNRWAESLNRELEERAARIAELQEEMAREQEAARQMAEGYAAKVAEIEADIRAKTQWAIDTETRLTAELRHQTGELGKAVEALHHTEEELEERTRWALSLQEEAARLAQLLALVRGSRWVRLGRQVGLGPELPAS